MAANVESGCEVVAVPGFGASFEGGLDAVGFGRTVVFASGFQSGFSGGAALTFSGEVNCQK